MRVRACVPHLSAGDVLLTAYHVRITGGTEEQQHACSAALKTLTMACNDSISNQRLLLGGDAMPVVTQLLGLLECAPLVKDVVGLLKELCKHPSVRAVC